MRNILLLFMLLGLGLSSCEKKEESPEFPSKNQQITVNGKNYDVQYLINGLSKITGMSPDKFYFDETERLFKNTMFSDYYRPETYAPIIDRLNSK
ncbi:hypothetical protein SAMN05660862_2286 [Sphingobacterium psychroaquaticum]|uniref:Uncharacterized protein n=1 Tax=Sphingobacterium psychroaquaticum TaxID=561061 RepID=A0A1X7JX78_9SPHI|nr:hypothetical protein SAMN05660862_2286 [Sphingobacterium psychroaquaticum]